MSSTLTDRPGALVLSLDFELLWGVRDHVHRGSPYIRNLLGARVAIPRMLELFTGFEIAATWATVGFLFAKNRTELMNTSPELRPSYNDRRLSPYGDAIG
jgi:hypothetical protein